MKATQPEVLWPAAVQSRYGITRPTRWRWERQGRLPARDVNVGGKTGWRRETIEAAEKRFGLIAPSGATPERLAAGHRIPRRTASVTAE
jgi:predicted DNA-binding transcriptional regulator AlpA